MAFALSAGQTMDSNTKEVRGILVDYQTMEPLAGEELTVWTHPITSIPNIAFQMITTGPGGEFSFAMEDSSTTFNLVPHRGAELQYRNVPIDSAIFLGHVVLVPYHNEFGYDTEPGPDCNHSNLPHLEDDSISNVLNALQTVPHHIDSIGLDSIKLGHKIKDTEQMCWFSYKYLTLNEELGG